MTVPWHSGNRLRVRCDGVCVREPCACRRRCRRSRPAWIHFPVGETAALGRAGLRAGLVIPVRWRSGPPAARSGLTYESGLERVAGSGGGVSLGGVPERTCSLRSGRTIDGVGRRSGGRFGAAAGVAGASAERAALSQTGRKPRRGCSTPGVELGRSSSKTPEGRGGCRARARRPSGSPGGDGRRIGAARREAEEPQGGRSPGGDRACRGRRTAGRRGRTPGTRSPEDGETGCVPVPARPGPWRGAQRAGLQRRGGDGPREGHRRTRRSKPLKGEAQERSGLKHGREGPRGASRREGRNPEDGT